MPANASSAQRFLTLDAFTQAGFEVVALLNEPSAAGFEYAHRYRSTITAKREYVLIYDLGGGTFDASLLEDDGPAQRGRRSARASSGSAATTSTRRSSSSSATAPHCARCPPGHAIMLLEECAAARKPSGPNTRRFLVDLAAVGKPPFSCPIDDVYTACVPLVDKTIDAFSRVLHDHDGGDVDWSEVAGIYVVGGAGSFPLVPAIAARDVRREAGQALTAPVRGDGDRAGGLSRPGSGIRSVRTSFAAFRGVSRGLRGRGRLLRPDRAQGVGAAAAGQPPFVVTRTYRAAHNIGHFRFVECSRLRDGHPDGDVTPYEPVFFAFDPDLSDDQDLPRRAVRRRDDGPDVEERYVITSAGPSR